MVRFRPLAVAVDLGSSRVRVSRGLRVVDAPAAGIRNGRIADSRACLANLRRRLDAFGHRSIDVTVAVPAIDDDAADTVVRTLLAAGAWRVTPVEQPLAAAIGAGIDIAEPAPTLLVDVGAGLVEIAVIGDGAIRAQCVLLWGMSDLGARLQERLRTEMSVWVTPPEAARALGRGVVVGIDIASGLPTSFTLRRTQVDSVLGPALDLIRRGVHETLDALPARVAGDVAAAGAVLVGGGAVSPGLPERLGAALGIPFRRAADPAGAVVNGLAAVIAG